MVAGANVFILFDTSNYMYRGFVFAQDAIAEFVRSLDSPDKVAFYSYSRDLSRAPLTPDRRSLSCPAWSAHHGRRRRRRSVQRLLLTVKDAAPVSRDRKVIVVFSNGPDNASMVPPEDVAELAQSTGMPIYMISTREAKLEPVSTHRVRTHDRGHRRQSLLCQELEEEQQSVRFDPRRSGTPVFAQLLSAANPNRGWRAIQVKLVGEHLKKYHIRTRNGYRPQPNRFSQGTTSTASASETTPASQ